MRPHVALVSLRERAEVSSIQLEHRIRSEMQLHVELRTSILQILNSFEYTSRHSKEQPSTSLRRLRLRCHVSHISVQKGSRWTLQEKQKSKVRKKLRSKLYVYRFVETEASSSSGKMP